MANDIRAWSRDWFELVWNRRDDSVIDRLASPEALSHGMGEDGQTAHGYDQFKRFRQAFLTAFPDLKIAVEDVLVDGDQSAIRFSFSGTHKGGSLGVPPTSRPFTSTGIAILRWKDGRIVEAWNEFDAAGMMRQLQSPTAKLKA